MFMVIKEECPCCHKQVDFLVEGSWMGMSGRVCEQCDAELKHEEDKICESYHKEVYESEMRAAKDSEYKAYMDAVYREEMNLPWRN